MDVDEEEAGDSTQRLRSVPDYGLEIDFEMLSSGEREVGRISAHGFDKRRPFLMWWPLDAEPFWRSAW